MNEYFIEKIEKLEKEKKDLINEKDLLREEIQELQNKICDLFDTMVSLDAIRNHEEQDVEEI